MNFHTNTSTYENINLVNAKRPCIFTPSIGVLNEYVKNALQWASLMVQRKHDVYAYPLTVPYTKLRPHFYVFLFVYKKSTNIDSGVGQQACKLWAATMTSAGHISGSYCGKVAKKYMRRIQWISKYPEKPIEARTRKIKTMTLR